MVIGKAVQRALEATPRVDSHSPEAGTVDDRGTATRASREFVIVSLAAAAVLLLALSVEVSHALAEWPHVGGWQINMVTVLAVLPTAFGIFSWRRWTQLRTEVAERGRAEEALRESEERFHRLSEAAFEGIAITDNGRILDANDRLGKMFGYNVAELIGMHALDLTAPESRDLVLQNIRSQHDKPYEHLALRKDGSIFPVEVCGKSIYSNGRTARVTAIRDITDRKRAEEAIRESEAKYGGFIETARDVIYTLSPDGVITSLNPAFEDITGWSRSEWLGRPFVPLIHPDDLPAGAENFRRILRGEDPPISEIRVRTASGGYVTGQFSAKPLLEDGKIVGAFGIVRDITERKQQQEALRESEERFRSAFKHAAIGMALVAPDGRLLQVNRACCESLGYSEQEMTSLTWQAITHPDDLKTTQNLVLQLLTGERTHYEVEKRFVHKDGSARWGHLTSSLLRDDGGKPLYFVSQVQDITERKRAEEALRESEEHSRLIVETAHDAFISIDARGVITDWNRQAEAIFGWSRVEAIDRPMTETIMPTRLREAHRRGLEHFLATGEGRMMNRRVEMTALHRDGHEFPVELAISAVPTGDTYTFNAFVHDITERRRTEEALRESEEKYRDLVENINDVIYEVDVNGQITYISPAVERLSGYSPADVIGRSFSEFVQPDDLPAIVASFVKGLGGDPEPSEYRLVIKSGDVRWVRSFGRPVQSGGRTVGYRAVLTDITERRRAEEALQKARDELEGKVEHQMLRRNPYGLTFRELTVLHLVAAGRSDKEIGCKLGISPLTAQKHVENIRGKMDAASRTEAGVRAVREGLLE